MYILVDTNVFLDLILERGDLSNSAKEFFKNAVKAKCRLYLSSNSIRDIGYIVSHIYHDSSKGKSAQMRAYELCHKVVSFTNDDAIEALYSNVDDYEDAVLVEIAKRELIDLIVTNNIKDFKNANFPVWTPEHFNKVISNTHI